MVGTRIGALSNFDNALANRLRPYAFWWVGMGLMEATGMRLSVERWLHSLGWQGRIRP